MEWVEVGGQDWVLQVVDGLVRLHLTDFTKSVPGWGRNDRTGYCLQIRKPKQLKWDDLGYVFIVAASYTGHLPACVDNRTWSKYRIESILERAEEILDALGLLRDPEDDDVKVSDAVLNGMTEGLL